MKSKYIKLYEEFREYNNDIQVQEIPEVELSDKTIDDVLSDHFFDEEKEDLEEEEVINVDNWKVY